MDISRDKLSMMWELDWMRSSARRDFAAVLALLQLVIPQIYECNKPEANPLLFFPEKHIPGPSPKGTGLPSISDTLTTSPELQV